MPRQSRADLIEHLQTQTGYVRKSARDFDDGDVSEAARLAVTLRVLVHNTRSSTSLLKQLGVQHQLRFLDTARRPRKPAGRGVIVHTWDAGLGALTIEGEGARFVAPLDDTDEEDRHGPQPFKLWWNRPVLRDQVRQRFTRKELVLFLAHKVGGVHVDPEMEPRFRALVRLNTLGWGWTRTEDGLALVVPAGPNDTPLGDPIPVNVRQIAYEVEETISGQLSHLVEPASADA